MLIPAAQIRPGDVIQLCPVERDCWLVEKVEAQRLQAHRGGKVGTTTRLSAYLQRSGQSELKSPPLSRQKHRSTRIVEYFVPTEWIVVLMHREADNA